jgi:hypothetical protein
MASPTATSTASLTATPTPSLSPPGSLFEIKTSPPLILAIAVVGIFALAMLARLKMVNGRLVLRPLEVNGGGASTWQRRTGRGQGVMGEEGGVGEKPVMWEVWMEGARRGLGKGKGDWDIMVRCLLFCSACLRYRIWDKADCSSEIRYGIHSCPTASAAAATAPCDCNIPGPPCFPLPLSTKTPSASPPCHAATLVVWRRG